MLEKFLGTVRFFLGTTFSRSYFIKNFDGTYRCFHHRGSPADRGVIRQIFVKRDYSLRKMARENDIMSVYNSILHSNQVPLIIDAGANIGASVVWFSGHFKESHIVAVEPDTENIGFLKRNTNGLNVDIHEAALGSTDGTVSLLDPGNGEWGYQTKNDINGDCRRESISRIVKEKLELGYSPFLIKVDIEGGESDLFEAETDWVELFPLIIIELHDWLLPKQNTSHNFIKRIGSSHRDFVYRGENIFSIKND